MLDDLAQVVSQARRVNAVQTVSLVNQDCQACQDYKVKWEKWENDDQQKLATVLQESTAFQVTQA